MSNKPLRPGKKVVLKKKCRHCELEIEDCLEMCFWCKDLIRKGWIPPALTGNSHPPAPPYLPPNATQEMRDAVTVNDFRKENEK